MKLVRCPPSESGVIMIVTLIALVVLLLGAAALLRSTDTAQLTASNLAFKRDLVNQGERGFRKAVQLLSSGGALASETVRRDDAADSNYSAVQLASDAHGIPTVLTNDTAFSAAGMTNANDVDDPTTRVKVRFVIDRQCASAGAADPSTCTLGPSTPRPKGGSEHTMNFDLVGGPVYRITIRAQGPRQSETYLQMTVTL